MSSVVVPFPTAGQRVDAKPACAEHDPTWWFEERHVGRARRVCAGCGYRSRCLDLALVNGERTGVWGGLTPAERERLPDAVVLPLRPRRHQAS